MQQMSFIIINFQKFGRKDTHIFGLALFVWNLTSVLLLDL